MRDIARKLRDLLDARERRNALLLFGLMLVTGVLEAVGVASVMPFIQVVADPGTIERSTWLTAIYEALGFSDRQSFLLFLGVIVFFIVVGSLVLKGVTEWAIARFAFMRTYTISSRLLRQYLSRPYSWYLGRNTSDLSKAVLSEVDQVAQKTLLPALQLVANGLVALMLIAVVVAANPWIALATTVIFGGTYGLVYLCLRNFLSRIGHERLEANRQRFQVAQEAMDGIKEIRILGLEENYLQDFDKPARRFARTQSNQRIGSQVPQHLLRAVAFGTMIAILLVLLSLRDGDLGAVLPLMALYALAASRLMPALQQTYKAVTQVRFGKPALDALHADWHGKGAPDASTVAAAGRAEQAPRTMRLERMLELRDVGYLYPTAHRSALEHIDLRIQAGMSVGIIGSTGAGKSTLVDLVLGLLEPTSGSIEVDGQKLHGETVRAWQRNVGYVPQKIHLTDGTIAANIALGMRKQEIDYDAVRQAARHAGLHDFVMNETETGYETQVGEDGVRLSGGQRQRIGIARALYRNTDLLVLDEATSALDQRTERRVTESLRSLSGARTIIIIAHRMSAVRECDEIILLENGRIARRGSYDDVVDASDA